MQSSGAPYQATPTIPHTSISPNHGFWSAVFLAAGLWLAWRVAAGSAFGLIDDQFLFEPSLADGHWRLFWGEPSGRFYPLCGREFLLLRQWGLVSAPLYYAVQAGKLLVGAWLARAILKRAGASEGAVLAACLLVFGSPAFMVSVSRLFVAELTPFVLFLGAVFLLGGPGGTVGWRAILGVVLSAAALFHKESGVAAVAGMGLMLALFPGREAHGCALEGNRTSAPSPKTGWGESRRQAGRPCRAHRLTGLALLASCALYLGCYAAFGLAFMQDGGYTATRTLTLAETAHFFIRNDLPLAVMLAMALVRLLVAARRREPLPAFQTSCLAGSAFYVGGFLALRIISPWYLLPAYAFILPALPWAWSGLLAGRSTALRRGIFLAVLGAGVLWSLAGYSFLDWNQASARAYQSLWSFLEARPVGHEGSSERLNLPRQYPSNEAALNLRSFLAFKGLGTRFAPAFDGLEDFWSFLKDKPGLAVFLPHTRLAPDEAALLARCRETLLRTPEPAGLPAALAGFFGLSSPDGSPRSGAYPTAVCRVFAPVASGVADAVQTPDGQTVAECSRPIADSSSQETLGKVVSEGALPGMAYKTVRSAPWASNGPD